MGRVPSYTRPPDPGDVIGGFAYKGATKTAGWLGGLASKVPTGLKRGAGLADDAARAAFKSPIVRGGAKAGGAITLAGAGAGAGVYLAGRGTGAGLNALGTGAGNAIENATGGLDRGITNLFTFDKNPDGTPKGIPTGLLLVGLAALAYAATKD